MLCGMSATSVAVVDLEEVLKDFEDANIADRTLQHSVKIWKNEFDSLRNAYENEMAEFETQKPMLSEEALLARQQELSSMRKQYENFAQDVWGEGGRVEQKHKELFEPVMEKINKVIEEIALEKSAEMVVDGSAGNLLYLSATLDITNDVISELNREYASVGSQFAKKVAVLTISQSGEEVITQSLGDSIRGYVNSTVRKVGPELNIELVKDDVISPIMTSWGKSFTGIEPLAPSEAMNIADIIGADFVFTGEAIQEGGETTIKLTLAVVSSRRFFTEETMVSEGEELFREQKVAEITANLLQIHVLAEETEPEGFEEEFPEEDFPEEHFPEEESGLEEEYHEEPPE